MSDDTDKLPEVSQLLNEFMGRVPGLSNLKLSELCEPPLDHTFISRIRRGNRGASRETLERLSKALQLTTEETERFVAAGGYIPDGLKHIVHHLIALPHHTRESIVEFARSLTPATVPTSPPTESEGSPS